MGRSNSGSKAKNNYILIIFDSCRYDSFVRARPRAIAALGAAERRWSYASWTSPSHYNLLIGLLPRSCPRRVYASEYYARDFRRFNERLGAGGVDFKSLVPKLYLPSFLHDNLGYGTHAMVSLPVQNPKTILNQGFDTYRLMEKRNDMRAMLAGLKFSEEQPSFYLLNVGETHYPYALPGEPPEAWPKISGVHDVFKHLDEQVVGGKLPARPEKFFNGAKLRQLRLRQVEAVKYLDTIVEQLFDIVPKNTYITITSDHGELFGRRRIFRTRPHLAQEGVRSAVCRRKAPMRDRIGTSAFLLLAAVTTPDSESGPELAYVGPGAGFAFLGSFLTVLAGFLLSFASVLWWPFRMLWSVIRRRRGFRGARIRRSIFLGLDGLDPGLTERWMAEGKLPNFSRLREVGSYRRLRTTSPSLSPVAWSTFATVSPARHNIFDFLNRNLKSYLPELSSATVRPPQRALRFGRLRIPLSRPRVELRRKSEPFWKILGAHGIGSTILRVPITFPPEKFAGRLLSAMCTPDLKGTQGSFTQFTTGLERASFENGSHYPLKRVDDGFEGVIEGPEDLLTEGRGVLRLPFRLVIEENSAGCVLAINGESYRLRRGEYTQWIRLTFRTALKSKVTGIARFLLSQTAPEVSLYVSPINIDPEHPALPISHPGYYAAYLAKLLGPYATVGMAEDTWALNERIIDKDAFLKQAWLIFNEREAMFASALERTRKGVVACVFDTSDRVQHMFYRDLNSSSSPIEEMYRRMDSLVGKTLAAVDGHTVLFVLSDHGFCSFRRGVNLNSWLHQNRYLEFSDGAGPGGRHLAGVDWARTRAYSLGLAGLYLNLKGRERFGIVEPGAEAESLKIELAWRLASLRDPKTDAPAVQRACVSSMLYKGPYLDAAPDLMVGYNDGYRASWDGAVGTVTAGVFEDNIKAWSGDHCVDPALVPGVLFSNRRIEAADPGIEDLAPTALKLFGLQPPAWMEGRSLLHFAEGGQS